MNIFLFFITFATYILFWDILLHTLMAINRKLALKVINKKDSNIARMLFALAGKYVSFQLEKDLRLQKVLPKQFMIISNHQSIIDIAAIFYSFPENKPRFVAKRELAKGVPMISAILQAEKHAIINREKDFSKTMKELHRLATMADEGICPVIFPEGTRSKDGTLGDFHVGAVRKVLETRPMPVVSVALDGGYRLSHLKDFTNNIKKAIYRIKIMSLYEPVQGKKEINSMLQKIHEELDSQLKEWHSIN